MALATGSERKTVDFPRSMLKRVKACRCDHESFSMFARAAFAMLLAYREAPISEQNEVRRILRMGG